MTATYQNRFDAGETLSPLQQRSLLTALGLGLLVTVLALAWAAVASRVERAPVLYTADENARVGTNSDDGALLRVEVARAQWLPEDASY